MQVFEMEKLGNSLWYVWATVGFPLPGKEKIIALVSIAYYTNPPMKKTYKSKSATYLESPRLYCYFY